LPPVIEAPGYPHRAVWRDWLEEDGGEVVGRHIRDWLAAR
jgi:hypothetical protein